MHYQLRMPPSPIRLLVLPILLLAAFLNAACVLRAPAAGPQEGDTHAGHDHSGHDHDHDHDHGHEHAHEAEGASGDLRGHIHAGHEHERKAPLRMNLACGWCDPYDHFHESHCGTPYVHGFMSEPAFQGTDLILGVTSSEDETEVEAELEWALTRRVGLIAELPWEDGDARGIGDAALALRVLLIEERKFLLSVLAEVEIPTGSTRQGLGEGHYAVGAGFLTWHDLGHWITLQSAAVLEHVPDEDETGLHWGLTLAKSFRARPLIGNCTCGLDEHRRPVWSLLAEVSAETALEGEEEAGETEGAWLLGASYPLAYDVDIRAAFRRTFGGDEDESAWTLGCIIHF